MKRTLRLLVVLLMVALPAVMSAGEPTIVFDSVSHDFGNIKSTGGNVTCLYEFTNTGDTPLVIASVTNGGCGCTTPSFPKAPIAPGKKGVIKITFNPAGRKGEFNREVKVRTNGEPKRISLKFKGVVIP
ncbi:MAG: DUF1573 domain-containing protein [Paramuribaculum sp.]|nr:DUF1573 domain-containing protein [Paramuribaculum sp.]